MTRPWVARTIVAGLLCGLLLGNKCDLESKRAGALANPGFEDGLSGWTASGAAFASQPTYADNVTAARVGAISIGGDYWRDLAYPIGIRGNYWIGTYEDRPGPEARVGTIQGDGPTGELQSGRFTIREETQFISFLVGGGSDTSRTWVELLEVARDEGNLEYRPVVGIGRKAGRNSEVLYRDWWDVSTVDRSAEYVIRIVDDSSEPWDHINVDDFRFLTKAPTDELTEEGLPSVLRTSLGRDGVWTDYDAPLWGAADLHTHPMSHLSMGGSLMHGVPDVGSLVPRGTRKLGGSCNPSDFRATTPEEALGNCGATHGGWGIDNTCADTLRAFTINVAMDADFVHQLPLIPTDAACPDGMENDAGLCYQFCPDGYHGAGVMCHKDCPDGYRDDGLYCAKPGAYGRGVGYVDDGRAACEAENPGGCEQYGALFYPECRDGYHAVGCCICSPDCPAGWDDIGVSCAKPTASCPAGFRDDGLFCAKPEPHGRGVGYALNFGEFNLDGAMARCEADHSQGCEQWGLLIYPKCAENYHAVGCCICSPDCPPGWDDIGVSCAKPTVSCPAGYRDDGLFCAKPEPYGRAVGYGTSDGRARCEAENAGGCEQWGLIWYPRCREGFHAFGCCVCTPDCPDGMTDMGVSCQKNGSFVRSGGFPPPSNLHGDHPHEGYPGLLYWPHWSSIAHQQMYADWIERAHRGGLNLLVALAVNNELLGEMVNGVLARDDRATADLQIDEIRAFIERHEFMREVSNPAELRQAVRDGRLAVIVGVEIDNIGNFNVGNPLLVAPEDLVIAEIRRLFEQKGVRYIFPLHFADNVFGGAAVKGPLFNLSNRWARTRPLPAGLPLPPGFLYRVEPSDDPLVDFRLTLLPEEIARAHSISAGAISGLLSALGELPFPPAFHIIDCPVPRLRCVPQFAVLQSMLAFDPEWDIYAFIPTGHANTRGLTPLGEAAIKEMMRLGMLIDIDHMSEKTANATLEIAREFSYPVVSGHTGFRAHAAVASEEPVDENNRSAAQLERLAEVGGMMGIGWAGGTTADFLLSYRHGFGLDARPSLSLGSDINGFESMPRPRHNQGVEAEPPEGFDSTLWESRVEYDGPAGLDQYSFGDRTWDYNLDGVAHIGLYPDAYQDLRNLGMTFEERTEFFNATDAFARMWDEIEVRKSFVD